MTFRIAERLSGGDSRQSERSKVNSSGLSVQKIELARNKFGLSQDSFCAAAGVSVSTYKRLLSGQAVRLSVQVRLEAAAAGRALPPPDPRIIASMHRSVMAMVAALTGYEVHTILSTNFAASTVPRRAAEIRRIAMYVLVVEGAVASGAALARAIGCTKQNVSQALASIEREREDDPALDALIQKIPL